MLNCINDSPPNGKCSALESMVDFSADSGRVLPPCKWGTDKVKMKNSNDRGGKQHLRDNIRQYVSPVHCLLYDDNNSIFSLVFLSLER